MTTILLFESILHVQTKHENTLLLQWHRSFWSRFSNFMGCLYRSSVIDILPAYSGKTFFKTVGVSLHYSTVYHPQSDGQTERVNQCLETYLRCFTCEKPSYWSRWLPMAEYWYNTNFHTSIAMTPFEALYGNKPVPVPLGPYLDSIVPAAVDMVQQLTAVLHNLKEYLVKAQNRIKKFDLKRRMGCRVSIAL